jgi:hypothetical protein
MATARSRLIDLSVARWYHCINRCLRRAFLLCEGLSDRRQWIERRLEELSQIFAVAVGGFTIMDNHLHVLLRQMSWGFFRGAVQEHCDSDGWPGSLPPAGRSSGILPANWECDTW